MKRSKGDGKGANERQHNAPTHFSVGRGVFRFVVGARRSRDRNQPRGTAQRQRAHAAQAGDETR